MIGILVLTSSLSSALHTLETPIPESLLKPRDYNPHPFEQSYHNYHGTHQHHSLNAIDTDYVGHSVYNIDVANSLPSRHPSNSVFRFLQFINKSPINDSFMLIKETFNVVVKHHINFHQHYHQARILVTCLLLTWRWSTIVNIMDLMIL